MRKKNEEDEYQRLAAEAILTRKGFVKQPDGSWVAITPKESRFTGEYEVVRG